MELIEQIRQKAKQNPKTIVLPEGTEERTLIAANTIIKEGIAKVILLGNNLQILVLAYKHNLDFISKAEIIDPMDHADKTRYAEMLCELRKAKGMTMEKASKLVEDPLYLACLLIKDGKADGEVAGADNATGNVLRPAFQIIKTLPGISVVSGAFIMVLKDKSHGDNGVMVFSDCAVHPDPNAKELAQIAACSAETAKSIAGLDPKVAMLSFSTKGSAKHDMATKVIDATNIAKAADPNLKIEGELQADAAIVESVGQKKAPGSEIAGKANVLIFPSLEAGNISYKLVQRLAGAEAIGPILQGMAAPINDLSRGCSVEDIVNLVAITVNQAQQK